MCNKHLLRKNLKLNIHKNVYINLETLLKLAMSYTWWCVLVTLGRQNQEDRKLKITLS